MLVTISHEGYIKRIPLDLPQAGPRRPGRHRLRRQGRRLHRDPLHRLHQRLPHVLHQPRPLLLAEVYDIPLLARQSKGRAIVNLLEMQEDESISPCWRCGSSTRSS